MKTKLVQLKREAQLRSGDSSYNLYTATRKVVGSGSSTLSGPAVDLSAMIAKRFEKAGRAVDLSAVIGLFAGFSTPIDLAAVAQLRRGYLQRGALRAEICAQLEALVGPISWQRATIAAFMASRPYVKTEGLCSSFRSEEVVDHDVVYEFDVEYTDRSGNRHLRHVGPHCYHYPALCWEDMPPAAGEPLTVYYDPSRPEIFVSDPIPSVMASHRRKLKQDGKLVAPGISFESKNNYLTGYAKVACTEDNTAVLTLAGYFSHGARTEAEHYMWNIAASPVRRVIVDRTHAVNVPRTFRDFVDYLDRSGVEVELVDHLVDELNEKQLTKQPPESTRST